jgi:hypothetical protein
MERGDVASTGIFCSTGPDVPTGIIGASPGGIGTAVMQSSMRSVLSFLDAPQLNSPEACISVDPVAYGEDGEVKNEGTRQFLRHYLGEYAAFVARVLDATSAGHIGDEHPDSKPPASPDAAPRLRAAPTNSRGGGPVPQIGFQSA